MNFERRDFGTIITLADRSTAAYKVECANTNHWGEWFPCSQGMDGWPDGYLPLTNGYIQFLSADDAGWHGSTLKIVNGVLQRTKPDGTRLDSPWWTGEKWRAGYCRIASSVMGQSGVEVWPKEDALRVKTNRSKLYVTVEDSPSRCLYVEGDYNDVTVEVYQGQQSNLIQDLASVYFKGKGNVLRGVAKGSLCAAFFNGPDNRTLDFTAEVEGIGADRGGVYWKKGSNGFRATNTIVKVGKREWPCLHGDQGFYIDDQTSNGSLYNCKVFGEFTRGVFVHGGYNVTVDRFHSQGPSVSVLFAPHFTTPGVIPTGNRTSGLTEVK